MAWVPALVALGTLGACEGRESVPSPESGDSIPSIQATTGVRVIETEEGSPRWILEADEALLHESEQRLDLRSLTVTFFDSEGHETSVLTAREGEVDQRARHLVARDSVVVRTVDGDLLETELLEWDNARQKILSDRAVRITQGVNLYTGVGLVSDPGLEEFEILRDFQGTVIEE